MVNLRQVSQNRAQTILAAKKPCIECGLRPKFGSRQRCLVCYTRTLGVVERVEESRSRLAMTPEPLRRRTVPAKSWPSGTRWCGGCQTFRDLVDFGKGASQCRDCVGAKSHAARIEKTYGIDTDDYDRLFVIQGGRCAICRQRPGKKRLAVDHDHKSGAVRGLLCSRCNHELLGAGFDSAIKLLAGWHYLDTPTATGLWTPPEDGLQVERITEDTKTPSKAWMLSDPPTGRATLGADTPLGVGSGMSVSELMLLGGGRDANGYYRLYGKSSEEKAPF